MLSIICCITSTEQRIRAYTQADASMECKIGGKFRMFGGHVSGTIKDLIPNERLVQAWRFESWPEGLNHI